MTQLFLMNNVSKIVPFKKMEKITLAKIYVLALGKNANFSYIDENVEKAARDGIYGIPVVGYLYQSEDGEWHMGEHEKELVIDGKKVYFKSKCVPYGFVLMNDNARYEEQTEPNGETKTYLVVDAALWTGRYPELQEAIYNEDTYFNQSMEITVSDYRSLESDKRFTEILSYDYSALCLLGKSDNPDFNMEPCFPMARVEAYKADEFIKLMDEFKAEFAKCYQNTTEKGGEEMTTETEVVIEDGAEVTPESTNNVTNEPEVSQVSSEEGKQGGEPEVTEATEGTTTQEEFSAAEAAESEPEHETETVDFSATYHELAGMLDKAVYRENAETWTFVMDFTTNTVYIGERCKETWDVVHVYRAEYVIDEEKHEAVVAEWEEIFPIMATAEEIAALESMKAEYSALKDYKAEREQADKVAEYNAVLDEFSDLAANEEFQTVKENYLNYESTDALRKECFALRGKSVTVNASRAIKTSEPVITIKNKNDSEKNPILAQFHREFGRK